MAAGDAYISCYTGDAARAAVDELRGARVVAFRFSEVQGIIPASALSHYPSLRRLDFRSCFPPPLLDLAGYTQLHVLRELVCNNFLNSYQLRDAQPLSQLEVLDLSRMQTAGADTVLTALTRLRELALWGSDLLTVPASMASLTRLTRLSLNNTQVSGGWQHLPLQLEHLDLGTTELPTVPPELSRLSHLTRLDLWENMELEGGFEVLSRLSSLARLNLTECRLDQDASLPPCLQWLDISANGLTAVPAALSRMAVLTYLDLQYDPIASGWQHLSGMRLLAHLNVESCGLEAVPQVFSQLTAVTWLDMTDNPIASGWQHLAGMQHLEGLSLHWCGLTAVPQVLSQLTALTSLDIRYNSISSSWELLDGMQHLSNLSIVQCSLTAVPQVLSQLTALTSLYAYSNPIASGWQHLSLLPLSQLWTDDHAHRIPPNTV